MRRGQRFLHKHWLDSRYEIAKQAVPLLHVITAVRNGIVYYKPIYNAGAANEHLGPSYSRYQKDFESTTVLQYVDTSYQPPAPIYSNFAEVNS